ncbi:M20 family metallopeptidase [Chloroflexia bacterium SDU3-3]|nr:M20 family metallopeptidase [Chloroflexia bacterium SDU3-3]
MTTTKAAAQISDSIAARYETYIEELRQLCAIECPTTSKAGVDAAGAWVRSWVARRGWELRRFPQAEVGDGLTATLRGGRPGGLRVLLAAHLDTVYPVGVAAARPMRQEGDKILGPGAADNKSGLLSSLYAMAALEDCGMLAPFEKITLMCGGDEETEMQASLALMRELAPEHDIALVMEAGRENGDIVGARKGNGQFVFEVHGRSAHAGVEPHKGANAILALAQKIIALQLLNGMRPGVTLNVGVIAGGTVPNSIADYAKAIIDVRLSDPADMGPVGDAIAQIAQAQHVPGTTTVVSDGWHFPPMARTPEIAALAEIAGQAAAELGFQVRDAATGGISYANSFATLGLPVLDGLGPVGGQDHSPSEYILASSIVPRTALLALLMLRAAERR